MASDAGSAKLQATIDAASASRRRRAASSASKASTFEEKSDDGEDNFVLLFRMTLRLCESARRFAVAILEIALVMFETLLLFRR